MRRVLCPFVQLLNGRVLGRANGWVARLDLVREGRANEASDFGLDNVGITAANVNDDDGDHVAAPAFLALPYWTQKAATTYVSSFDFGGFAKIGVFWGWKALGGFCVVFLKRTRLRRF